MVKQLASVEVASPATNARRKRKRRKMEEFEIDWIPEDTGPPYEADEELGTHTIDKMYKAKFGHTNWARMSAVTPFDLHNNPCDIDYENGIVFFHKAINV